MITPTDPNGNFKTRLCRNWLQTAKCRYRDTCYFAHGQDELTFEAVLSYGDMFKTKNCRTFYQTKNCKYGDFCMFRHEHHVFKQLHRSHYKPHLFMYETMYASAPDKGAFLQKYEPVPFRLPIFRAIHAATMHERAVRHWVQASASTSEESHESAAELSETDYPELSMIYGQAKKIDDSPMGKSKSVGSLNTTMDSEDFPQKAP